MDDVLAFIFIGGEVNETSYVGGDYEVTFLKINDSLRELVNFVSRHIGRGHVGQAFIVSVYVPLIAGKEFIMVVDDQLTMNYICGYARRGEVVSLKFYIVLKPILLDINREGNR